MPVLSRLILIFGLALYHPASALAQSSSETMPEALRRTLRKHSSATPA